ncbi:MAG: hypothetical protein KGJ60_06575, partial [Verrucomicrobiota bacterium]|nr:hypothetical protein [Verrucomicrobiota bacterium]
MIGISLGRFHLANQDLPGASAAFAQALALSPTNETANALYAATRLLVLPDEPAGSNFLTRVGFPTDGRNLYNWTARLPKDTNGILLAPTGVRAGDFTAQLRTNVLLSVTGAISNLAAITDTNFTLDLSSNETTLAEVTVDYGDLKLIQAALYGAQYLIYALNAQNLDAQLTDLRSLYTNGILSVGQVLADYPQLFTFATTNDLQAARAAFTNGVDAYLIASAFIRSRPTNIVRLFNYDRVSAQGEADFRFTLQDLRFSLLAGPQTLAIKPNLTVNMATQFTGGATWRSLLPRFDGNSIELGTFPDLTFGGGIDGLDQFHVEDFLSGYFKMLPVGGAPEISAGSGLNLAFTTLPWHYYALEASGNL